MSYCDFIETVGTNLSLGFDNNPAMLLEMLSQIVLEEVKVKTYQHLQPIGFLPIKEVVLTLDIISKNPWQIGYDPKIRPILSN